MLLNWDTEAHGVFGGFAGAAGAAETAKTATREGGGGGGLEPRKGEDFTFGTNERTNERTSAIITNKGKNAAAAAAVSSFNLNSRSG